VRKEREKERSGNLGAEGALVGSMDDGGERRGSSLMMLTRSRQVD
jgi:hypothetical protein